MNKNLLSVPVLLGLLVVMAVAAVPMEAKAYTTLYDWYGDSFNDTDNIIYNETPQLGWYTSQSWVGISADDQTWNHICASSGNGAYTSQVDGSWYSSPQNNRVLRWTGGSWELYPAWTPHLNSITCTSPYPNVYLDVSPSTIQQGQSSTLSWDSQTPGCTPGNFNNYTYVPGQEGSVYGCWDSCDGVDTSVVECQSRTYCGYYWTWIDEHYDQPQSGSMTVSPSQTTTYSYQCESSVAYATLTVSPPNPPPAAYFAADPTTINGGQSTSLTWSSSNASYCVGGNFSTGNQTGGVASVSPSATTGYSVTCYGSGGQAVQYATVTVNSCAANQGQACASSANSCSMTGSGTIQCNGTCNAVTPPNSSCPVTPQCSDGVDNDSDNYTDYSGNDPGCTSTSDTTESPDPSCLISATPSTIPPGGTSQLSWSCSNVSYCAFTDTGSVTIPSDTRNVSPGASSVYQLNCSNGGASRGFPVNVTVANSTAYLTAFPQRVNLSNGTGNTQLSWSAAQLSPAAVCNLTKNGSTFAATGANLTANGSGAIATSSVGDTISAQTIYKLTCGSVSSQVIVNVNGQVQEF